MTTCYFLSVDYQHDFADKDGIASVVGDSPDFIDSCLIPFLRNHDLKVSEIISDYRLPRGKSHNESCVPGTLGYKSLLPDDLRFGNPHIKCMHNPIWTRENIGIPGRTLGKEYQDPEKFNKWVSVHFPDKNLPIIIFGETMDCCLLNTAQELYFRGYNPFILYEATDPMPERQPYKKELAENSTLALYTKIVHFEQLESFLSE